MRTYIATAELKSLFNSGVSRSLDAEIARMSVLYEDLRIELFAIDVDSIKDLDIIGEGYRRLYFLRRSFGTLLEFSEALLHLNGLREFRTVESSFPVIYQRRWRSALKYFKRISPLLKEVRNDIGGHFGYEAAVFAITHFQPSAMGKIGVSERDKYLRLFYAEEIVATAMLRHPPGKTASARATRLIRMAVVAYRYAAKAVEALVGAYLSRKFGRG